MRNLIAIRRVEFSRIALIAAGLLALVLPLRTASAQSALFDFDTGVPVLDLYQPLPVDQTADGVTAHFRAVGAGFSVQTASSMGGKRLSLFSGKFLVPDDFHTGNILEVQFSELVTNVTFAFATIQPPKSEETPIRLTAYANATNTPVGVTNVTADYGSDTWPMGTLTFHSGTPFNLVRISVPRIVPTPTEGQATDFCLDNLTVQRAGGQTCTITASSSPAGGGLIIGGGGYSAGLTATLTAEAELGHEFVSWTEGGTVVSSSPSFSFVASADRTLVANFTSIFAITTSSSPEYGGTTSGDGNYGNSANVTVGATASNGYGFVNWTEGGSVVTNAASFTFVATADRALVANFSPLLSIAFSEPGVLVLSWPVSANTYYPLQNDSFDPDTWVEITDPPFIVGDQFQVLVTPSAGLALYRLYVPY
jgi:Divergent InlB B-repeat domain